MNYYTLNNKVMDNDFLNGKSIYCNAVLPLTEFTQGRIKEGGKIVVKLSNGRKYMGSVVSFRHTIKKDIVEGELEILKVR